MDNGSSPDGGLLSEIRENGPAGKRSWYARAFSNEGTLRHLKVRAICLVH